jgi:hypothetical protein
MIPLVRNTAYGLVHEVIISVHNARDPRREEWDVYLDMVSSLKVAFNGDCARFRQLIFTDGGSPSSAQRKSLVDIAKGLENHGKVRVVLVSRSVVARSVVTAFRWLGFPMLPCAPDELDRACAFLGLTPAQARDICDATLELCAAVDGPIRSASRVEAYRAKLSA